MIGKKKMMFRSCLVVLLSDPGYDCLTCVSSSFSLLSYSVFCSPHLFKKKNYFKHNSSSRVPSPCHPLPSLFFSWFMSTSFVSVFLLLIPFSILFFYPLSLSSSPYSLPHSFCKTAAFVSVPHFLSVWLNQQAVHLYLKSLHFQADWKSFLCLREPWLCVYVTVFQVGSDSNWAFSSMRACRSMISGVVTFQTVVRAKLLQSITGLKETYYGNITFSALESIYLGV